MRILQILPELNVGGVETGTVDFAKFLAEHGHHSVVVSNGGNMVAELEKNGITHYKLPVHKKSLWTAFQCIKQLKAIIEKEKIDIVHARSRVPAWIAYFACRQTQSQFITTCHGYYSKHFLSRVMGFSKLVIVPSEVIGRHMIDNFHVPPETIRVIPRSVDLKKFQVPREQNQGKSDYTIAMVGRITPLKGHSYFLKAMAQVVRSLPCVKVWIIGDVPEKKESYKQELEVLVKRLGLTQRVEFMGNRSDIPQLLAKTDVLVMSSIMPESFGRVVLEAQAAEVPVVATQVGGVVEVIEDGKTGLLVLPKDTEAMARAVLKILNDKKFAQELTSQATKKLGSKYTLSQMAEHTLKVYKELLDSKNILVIKMSSIGDVILATASLKAIRSKFPKARIFCLVDKESVKVLQRCPYIDDLIVYDNAHTDKGYLNLIRFSRKLRKQRFDLVIDFQNNIKSHLLSFLSFPYKSFGYDNKKLGFLLSHPIKDDFKGIPPVEHQFRILDQLGISLPEELRLNLWPSKKDQQYVQELLDSQWMGNSINFVGVNISASSKWPTKNWPLAYIAKMCDQLAAKNIRVVVTGMEKDKDLAQQLQILTKTKPAIVVGKTDVLQLAVLIQRCKVFISPDSAPLHIAAAMQTPFIAFFGPTDSRRHLPPAKSYVVLKKDLPCSPCYSSKCRIGSHACMRDISVEEVVNSVQRLMN